LGGGYTDIPKVQLTSAHNVKLPAILHSLPLKVQLVHPSFTGSRDRLQNIPPHGRCTHRWKVQEAAQQHWRTPPFALLGDSLSFPVTGSDPSWSFGSQTHKKNSHRMAAIGIGMDRIYLSFLARRNVVAMGCGKW